MQEKLTRQDGRVCCIEVTTKKQQWYVEKEITYLAMADRKEVKKALLKIAALHKDSLQSFKQKFGT